MGIKIGFTLPNRGVLFGATTSRELVDLAEIADKSGGFNSVWVGDSLFGKPRLEAITLLAAIAARTESVRLGPACMASFPLRDPIQLAYQWASLDLIAEGRTVLVACTGIVPQAGGEIEAKTYNVTNRDRVQRLTEGIQVLKKLWTEDNVSFTGEQYSFENVTIEPKPAASPRPPIWIANNAPGTNRDLVSKTHRRVIKHADGWQTSKWEADDLAWRLKDIDEQATELGRDPRSIERHLYHNVNLNDDRDAAIEESKKFLDLYYTTDYARDFVEGWVATGPVEQVVEHIKVYEALGFDEITLRITSWNQREQLDRLMREVLPHFGQSSGQRASTAQKAAVD
ncbi:MAG TPA: LLM class flavin-dependent oxidoreductase [Thermomicrobiales bacterium]|nr:LLM class flavin-dependent oxidoreductase [Thermomicrobiales bacterium]